MNELGELGLVEDARAEIRSCPTVPLFKLSLINGAAVFFRYYPVHTVTLDASPTAIWDLMGNTILFHRSADANDDTIAS
ncbi:hypothetical protein [Amycolatopsis sp. WGS_07]|uniref:hypothetical protein n=1 Tax=Amycolatopsis sp. WGS_07 TaxID=3076764 RepID=UPI0038739CE7